MRGGIVPVDPFQGFPFDPADGFPRAQKVDDLGFEQTNRAFGQRIVHCPADDCIAIIERDMNLRRCPPMGRSPPRPIVRYILSPDIANHDPLPGS